MSKSEIEDELQIRPREISGTYGINPNNHDDLPLARTEDSYILETVSSVRGYHVMAIVLCCLVLASIVMCRVTWKFRHKIVLRAVIM